MESPTQLFADTCGISAGDDRFAGGFDDGGSPSSKVQLSGMCMWGDETEETTEIGELQQHPMFVQPGLYAEEGGNAIMALRDRTNKTNSVKPYLLHSSRRTSSLKSESSPLKSESSPNLSASTAITSPDAEPPKKRTRQTRKVKKEVDDDKRSHFLERNRIAASKCREKKKQFVSGLEETKIALENQHAQLQVEYNSLVTEVGSLKHTLMTHAKCNDDNIDAWIAIEARKFVQTSNMLGQQRAAAAGAAQASEPYPHSRHSSDSSVPRGDVLGSFSNVSTAARRDSLAYSQASLTHTSPTDLGFPSVSSPDFGREPAVNFDHMPDDLFGPEP